MSDNLTQLGRKTPLPASPDEAHLELIAWDKEYIAIRLVVSEFTSLCPVTGAPDFGRIVIDYCPHNAIIESKSLKLYMGSFRNHGSFHEAIVADIGNKLYDAMHPAWLRVCAFFNARGGIPIDACWQTSQQPKDVYVPPIELALRPR